MRRLIASAIVFFALASAQLASAQTPITVWVYGDGNSGRMYSELRFLLSGTGLTVVNKAIETSGTSGLSLRMYADFVNTPQAQWPDVVLIGYSASAASLWACATNTWTADVASQEAFDILSAADAIDNAGIEVLLSIAPNVPSGLGAGHDCLQTAFSIVNAFVSQSGFPTVNWALNRSTRAYWAFDGVHLSCDPARYAPAGFTTPCLDQNGNNTPRSGRSFIGSFTVAQRVRTALQSFQ